MKSFTKYLGIYVLAVILGLGLVLLSPTATKAGPCGYPPCFANCDVICMAQVKCCYGACFGGLDKRYTLSAILGSNCQNRAYTFISCVVGCTPS